MKNRLSKSGPIKLLQHTERGELGKGNLGVVISRAGIGKTACLIHLALAGITKGENIIHVSFQDMPDKIEAFYDAVFKELMNNSKEEVMRKYSKEIDKNRIILSFKGERPEFPRIKRAIENIVEPGGFNPDKIMVDDLNFEDISIDLLKRFRELSQRVNVETWFTALSHRHIKKRNQRGIPYPCSEIDHLFSLIMEIEPEESGTYIKLLKDHSRDSIQDLKIRIDPSSFLAIE